jgi:hypothetical protein
MQRVSDLPWPADLFNTDASIRRAPALVWSNPASIRRRTTARPAPRLLCRTEAGREVWALIPTAMPALPGEPLSAIR